MTLSQLTLGRFGAPLLYIPNSHPHNSHIPIMPSTFAHEFNAPAFKGKVSFSTGIFINGQFVDGSDNTTIEYEPFFPSILISLSSTILA